MLWAVVIAALAVVACRDAPKTAVRLVVNLPAGAAADQLHIEATVGNQPLLTADLPKQVAGNIASPSDFVVWVDDSVAGQEVAFSVDGLHQSTLVAHGDASVTPKVGKTLRLTVDLFAASQCPTGQLNCGGTCTDATGDRFHCGRCDVACDSGQVCRSSTCTHNPCGDGQHECSGSCFADSDAGHCGPSCTACPAPTAHGTASCVQDECQIACNAGFVECPGACVDLNTDPANCGTCGHACGSGQICQGSNCATNPCGTGSHYCAPSGCVSNTDVNHCGTSCTPCPAEHGTATCDGVSCGITCSVGYHDCGGQCVSSTSLQSCGQSCTACPDPTNGSPTCDGTRCGVACDSGYQPCGLDCILSSDSCGNWRQVSVATHPTARAAAAMAYDAQRHVVVLFGGWNGADFDETWEYDGSVWSQKSPTTKPTARDSAAMTYDPLRQKVVLFGGFSQVIEGDTWLWDGTNWTKPVLAGSAPTVRYGATATWDDLTSRVVMFGGYTGSLVNEAWLWDGSGWSQCTTACSGTPPAGRIDPAVFRDSQQLVVFGGGTSWGMASVLGDTYVLGIGGWSSLAVAGPSARGAAAFAYDSMGGSGLLFGGMTGTNVSIGETWSWSSGTWTLLTPSIEPSARGGAPMVFDAQRRVMVMFGGFTGAVFLDETWEYEL
jgi:hypothetical protein